jgi:hypothetical protein
MDANYGCLLTGDGKGQFTYMPQTVSGLCIKGDVKSVQELTVDGKNYLVLGVCNEALQFYSEQ